jgi:hypothetical protein
MNTTLDKIAGQIIKEQGLIIGPIIAWSTARKINGLKLVDEKTGSVELDASRGREVVDSLVREYESLFGLAAREVCKDAAASLIAELPQDAIPSSLR